MLWGLSDAAEREFDDLSRHGVLSPASVGAVTAAVEPARGSNAWAIAGWRTRSGGPILANDPHLAVETPGTWYVAHLESADGLHVAGLTLAGVPGVVIGHNGRVAWGITMAQLDDADVEHEELDRLASGLLEEREEIGVRGGEPRSVVVQRTDRGVVVGLEPVAGGVRRAALLRSTPDLVPSSIDAFLRAARASGREAIEAVWSTYHGPAINVCWAVSDGSIGLRLAGAVPRRRGDAGSASGWDGLVPDHELPRRVDPPDGFVVSANDDWATAGDALPYRGFFASGDRVLRLREVLSGEHGSSAANSNALQNDVMSRYALRLVRVLERLAPRDADARTALDTLRAWDGRVERMGVARLFHAFATEAASRLEARTWAELDRAVADAAAPERLENALAAALLRVRSEDGPDPREWNWGRVHSVWFEHPLSPAIPWSLVRRFVDVGPVPMPGDAHSPNVQAYSLPRGPRVRHIPSARIVIDLGAPDASTFVLPLGQSAHRADTHYADQTQAWAAGASFPLPFSAAAVARAATSVLRLEP
jgi:penicillin amidase